MINDYEYNNFIVNNIKYLLFIEFASHRNVNNFYQPHVCGYTAKNDTPTKNDTGLSEL